VSLGCKRHAVITLVDPIACHRCQAYDHVIANCPKSGLMCFRCAEPGHIARDCSQESPRCLNCGQAHSTRDSRCVVRREAIREAQVAAANKVLSSRVSQELPVLPLMTRRASPAMAEQDRPSYADTVMAGVRIRSNAVLEGPRMRVDIPGMPPADLPGATASASAPDFDHRPRIDRLSTACPSLHSSTGSRLQELEVRAVEQLAEVAVQKALSKILDREVKKAVGTAVATEVKSVVASAVGMEVRSAVAAAVAEAMEPALKYLMDRFLAATSQASSAASNTSIQSLQAPPALVGTGTNTGAAPSEPSSRLSAAGSPTDGSTSSNAVPPQ
jgi:hypothetical protein